MLQLATKFVFSTEFFFNSLETCLRVCKRSYGGHFGFINCNKLFLFSIKCLKPGIYRLTSLLELPVFMCDQNCFCVIDTLVMFLRACVSATDYIKKISVFSVLDAHG